MTPRPYIDPRRAGLATATLGFGLLLGARRCRGPGRPRGTTAAPWPGREAAPAAGQDAAAPRPRAADHPAGAGSRCRPAGPAARAGHHGDGRRPADRPGPASLAHQPVRHGGRGRPHHGGRHRRGRHAGGGIRHHGAARPRRRGAGGDGAASAPRPARSPAPRRARRRCRA